MKMGMGNGIDETAFELMKQNCDHQTNYIKEKLDDMEVKLDKIISDHESRIRNIESDKKPVTAITTAITTLISLIGYIIYRKI